MLDKIEVVEPFKHGDRKFQAGEILIPSDYSEAEVAAWHAAGWVHDRSANPLEDQPIYRGRHRIEPQNVKVSASVEAVS